MRFIIKKHKSPSKMLHLPQFRVHLKERLSCNKYHTEHFSYLYVI